MRSSLAILVVGFVAACETTAAPPPAPPATATASATPAPAASATTCLMTHICSCNVGCARVASAGVREGTKVTAQTGSYAGKEMLVLKEKDAAGNDVLALSDREHNMPCELSRESKSLMGFLCAAKDSGPVPVNACAKGCD